MEYFSKYASLVLILAVIGLIRYVLIAGTAFIGVWKIGKNRLAHRRIQKKPIKAVQFKNEVFYSMSTFIIFGLTGVWVAIWVNAGWMYWYKDFYQYGWNYFFISSGLLILLHDTYFYFTHRLMHHPILFKRIHKIHHQSSNPSPWAAFCFHPFEAIIQASIIPLGLLIMPLHSWTIFTFLIFMTIMNVIGHLGYELYPGGFVAHPLWGLNNTSTHHNMHHLYVNGNYGLYFNWWDRWLGTNFKTYSHTFDELTDKKTSKSSHLSNQNPAIS